MNSSNQVLGQIKKIYERAKKTVVYIDIVFLLVVLFFEDILGPWRDKLFGAAAIGLIAILFETVLSLSDALLQARPERNSFLITSDAFPKIREIVSQDVQTTSVKIIAVTGGTSAWHLMPYIIANSKAENIELRIGILDQSNQYYKKWTPSYWPQEYEATIKHLKTGYGDKRVSIELRIFKTLSVPHGMLINNDHLFLKFFSWTNHKEYQLTSSQQPHHYYHRSNAESTCYFDLFESWFEYSPSEPYPLT